ncbi:glutathione synthase/RimK-type ligase-like ATP-grasp enzyme [Sphingomonas sp. UYAg733]
MITAIGLGTDPTIRHFVARCEAIGVEVELIDLHDLALADWMFPLPGQDAIWRDGDEERRLYAGGRYYVRPIDVSPAISSPRRRMSWQGLQQALCAWLESIGEAIVINRPGHFQDNGSKPLHEALLARSGFLVPESLTSSDGDALMSFARAPSIVKTISGTRADCWMVAPDDFIAFQPESGPVHLQRLVEGADVRAHVVGDAVLALRIDSDTTDYRIDGEARYAPIMLPDALTDRMTRTARDMGLIFSGWDFKLDKDGQLWLLEANPMPGYNSYDNRLDGSITAALVAMLTEARPETRR